MLQTLSARGIETRVRSVDRKKNDYLAWRSGFEAGGIRLCRQEQLLLECSRLLELDRKVDKPNGGGKNTTDAAAGAFANAISSPEIAACLRAPPRLRPASMPRHSMRAVTINLGFSKKQPLRMPREHRL
jgi:hypothetical protein